jgi:hypothetical protein
LDQKNSIEIFTAIDPVNREITLLETVWADHILVGHPEMNVAELKTTIEKPNAIIETKRTPNTYVYCNNETRKTDLYVNVFVGFTDSTKMTGYVKTAYITSTLIKGKPTWIRKKY